MASFTRKAIMDSFMKLVDQRPISKITIKDIVEDCGVNRNTFYYHFADIPALIEAIVHDQAEELIRNHSTITTIEDALNVAVDSILQHRRAALHIFNSVSRDVYERYLMQICPQVMIIQMDMSHIGSHLFCPFRHRSGGQAGMAVIQTQLEILHIFHVLL